ncbi:hypothetical protein BT93_H2919 [Corymbia citriodora subsp. variegata]|nr:hypothetical protein BT93_H2919 [Corymbia citriodora subsp. variegata]
MTHLDSLVTACGFLWFCPPVNVIYFDLLHHGCRYVATADQSSAGIIEDIEKCRNSALERKKGLEEEKKQFQRAAYAVIDMLNVGN